MAKLAKTKAKDIVKKLLIKINDRFKQEFVGENDENLDRLVHQYRAQASRIFCKNSQKWSKWNDHGPILMPDYTRIYYRKGETEIVLQEFPPQVRLMKLMGSLVSRENTSETISEAMLNKVYLFSLALPFVVFIFKFVKGDFYEVKMAFSDCTLKTLEEQPLKPYLSNIDSELKVCLGREFEELRKTHLEKGNIYQQIAFILNHFWQTVYSDEWAGNYWGSKSNFADDPRLDSVQNWEKASVENPLFVIDDVSWLRHEVETFGELIVKLISGDGKTNKFQEDLYKEIVDTILSDIKKSIEENLTTTNNQLLENFVEELSLDLIESL